MTPKQAGYEDGMQDRGQSFSGPSNEVRDYMEGYRKGAEMRQLRLAGERARLERYNIETGRPNE